MFLELSREGKIVEIIDAWEKIYHCSEISVDKVRDRAEKCLLESFDKASKNHDHLKVAYQKLKEVCMHGTLFSEIDSKIKLMKKCAVSLDKDIHALVVLCLNETSFHDIPNKDVENIVLHWFDQASKRHCGLNFNRNELSDSLVRLYAYVGEIYSNEWLSSHTELMEQMDAKTYNCLKTFHVVDVIKAIPKMEQFENQPIEDVFKTHIHQLFKIGLENGDITKQDLIGHTKKFLVNSK